jgi:hypothetical protein
VPNTITNTFTIPNVSLPGNTLNQFLLFGTSGIQAAGGPQPDFTLPNGFLFTAGGSINFFGSNSNTYPALPTNGLASYNWLTGGVITTNIVHNYAGQMGTVNGVPEPSTLILTSAGVGLYGLYRRRSRRRAPVCAEQP